MVVASFCPSPPASKTRSLASGGQVPQTSSPPPTHSSPHAAPGRVPRSRGAPNYAHKLSSICRLPAPATRGLHPRLRAYLELFGLRNSLRQTAASQRPAMLARRVSVPPPRDVALLPEPAPFAAHATSARGAGGNDYHQVRAAGPRGDALRAQLGWRRRAGRRRRALFSPRPETRLCICSCPAERPPLPPPPCAPHPAVARGALQPHAARERGARAPRRQHQDLHAPRERGPARAASGRATPRAGR